MSQRQDFTENFFACGRLTNFQVPFWDFIFHRFYPFWKTRLRLSATVIFTNQQYLYDMIFIRLEYSCKPRIFLWGRKLVLLTAILLILKNSFQQTLFLASKIFILTTVACISLENSSHRPLFLQASSKLGSVTAISIFSPPSPEKICLYHRCFGK